MYSVEALHNSVAAFMYSRRMPRCLQNSELCGQTQRGRQGLARSSDTGAWLNAVMPLILSVGRSDDTLCEFFSSSVGRLSSAKTIAVLSDSVAVPPLLHLLDLEQQPVVELQSVETKENRQAASLQVGQLYSEPTAIRFVPVVYAILYVALLARHRVIQDAGLMV